MDIKAFAVGKYDVTVAEWTAFIKDTHRATPNGCAWTMIPTDSGAKPWDQNPHANWQHLGFEQGADHPVVCVSFNDVQDYLAWLSKKTGKKYRLPTEAEWEYAARAGSKQAYPWGDAITHDQANYGEDSCCAPMATGRDRWLYTSPVTAFPPNSFGLYNMVGNVLQYTEDYLSANYVNAPANGAPYRVDTTLVMTGGFSKMTGLRSQAFRMVRGGDWGDPPDMIRVSARNWAPGPHATLETYRSAGLGFRVARSL